VGTTKKRSKKERNAKLKSPLRPKWEKKRKLQPKVYRADWYTYRRSCHWLPHHCAHEPKSLLDEGNHNKRPAHTQTNANLFLCSLLLVIKWQENILPNIFVLMMTVPATTMMMVYEFANSTDNVQKRMAFMMVYRNEIHPRPFGFNRQRLTLIQLLTKCFWTCTCLSRTKGG
jgi:fatty acid desaturase